MIDSSRVKRRAAVTLLRGLKSRSALGRAKPALLALAGSDDGYAPNQLAAAIEDVLTQLSSEPNGRRRFDVLRRCDVDREPHDAIADDVGVSRSQFYRDLREARERFADAIAERLNGGAAPVIDPRFLAIEALRDGGQYARAASMADVLARAGDREDAARALCLRADLEIESGDFLAARQTAGRAKRLVDGADNTLRETVEAECELADYEAAYCLGSPESPDLRRAAIARLRRCVERGNASLAPVLVKALIQETSLQFGQGDVAAARSAVDEAGTLARKFPLVDRRLAVDVRIRASGLKALDAGRVGAALDDARGIVADAARQGDVRALRLGLQAISSHLLTLGNVDEAKRQALEAWALIDLFGSELDRLVVLSSLARIDVHRRDGYAALEWIALADRSSCNAFTVRQALSVSRAEALALTGRPQSAVDLAREVQARSQRWPRVIGRAKVAEAIALSGLRRGAEARRCSERAIELSRDAGPLLELHALDLNVRLTGNPRSLHSLRMLQAALHGASA
ncbi:MAG TPA: hypothetical protein VGF98_13545 [Candidatus Tumulicola sp.]|jgi:hypothetical protein